MNCGHGDTKWVYMVLHGRILEFLEFDPDEKYSDLVTTITEVTILKTYILALLENLVKITFWIAYCKLEEPFFSKIFWNVDLQNDYLGIKGNWSECLEYFLFGSDSKVVDF